MSTLLQGKRGLRSAGQLHYIGNNRWVRKRHGQRGQKDRGLFTIAQHLRVQDQIERLAYQLWQEGGCRQNTPLSDWLQAESEVLREIRRSFRP